MQILMIIGRELRMSSPCQKMEERLQDVKEELGQCKKGLGDLGQKQVVDSIGLLLPKKSPREWEQKASREVALEYQRRRFLLGRPF